MLQNPHYTQNPPIGYRSVSDTWSLVNPVRKVEFELLLLSRVTRRFLFITSALCPPSLTAFPNQCENLHLKWGSEIASRPFSALFASKIPLRRSQARSIFEMTGPMFFPCAFPRAPLCPLVVPPFLNSETNRTHFRDLRWRLGHAGLTIVT